MFIMVEKVIVCKVLYDFDSAEPGELPLKEGQYIQLLDKVQIQSCDWWCDKDPFRDDLSDQMNLEKSGTIKVTALFFVSHDTDILI